MWKGNRGLYYIYVCTMIEGFQQKLGQYSTSDVDEARDLSKIWKSCGYVVNVIRNGKKVIF